MREPNNTRLVSLVVVMVDELPPGVNPAGVGGTHSVLLQLLIPGSFPGKFPAVWESLVSFLVHCIEDIDGKGGVELLDWLLLSPSQDLIQQ